MAIQFCLIFTPFLILLIEENLHKKDILKFLYHDLASIIATINLNSTITKKIEDLTMDQIRSHMVKEEFDTDFIDKLSGYLDTLQREMRRLNRYDLKYLAEFNGTILWIDDGLIRILNKYDLGFRCKRDKRYLK